MYVCIDTATSHWQVIAAGGLIAGVTEIGTLEARGNPQGNGAFFHREKMGKPWQNAAEFGTLW